MTRRPVQEARNAREAEQERDLKSIGALKRTPGRSQAVTGHSDRFMARRHRPGRSHSGRRVVVHRAPGGARGDHALRWLATPADSPRGMTVQDWRAIDEDSASFTTTRRHASRERFHEGR